MIRERDKELREQTVKFFEERKRFHEAEWQVQAMARELESRTDAQRIAEMRLTILRKDFDAYCDNGVRSHWNEDRGKVMEFLTHVDSASRMEILHRLLARCEQEQQLAGLAAFISRNQGSQLVDAAVRSFQAAVTSGAASLTSETPAQKGDHPEAAASLPAARTNGLAEQAAGQAGLGPDQGIGLGLGGTQAEPIARADASMQTEADLGAAALGGDGGGRAARLSPASAIPRRNSMLAGSSMRIRTAPDFRRRRSSLSLGPGGAPAGLQLTWRGSYVYTPTKAFVPPSALKKSGSSASSRSTAHSASEDSDEDAAEQPEDPGRAADDGARGAAGAGGSTGRALGGRRAREDAAFDGPAAEAGGKPGREVRFREAEDAGAKAASVRALGKLIAHVYEEKTLADDVSRREGRPPEDARSFLKHFFFRRYGLLSMAAKQHRLHLRRLRRLRDESLRLRSFAVVMGLADGLDYSPAAAAFFLSALGRTLRPHAGIVEALAGKECLIELDKCCLVTPNPPPPPALTAITHSFTTRAHRTRMQHHDLTYA